jgi:hypothetical protein
MSDAPTLGDEIARRDYELVAPGGAVTPVVVRIGRPRPDPAPGGDWLCPYHLAVGGEGGPNGDGDGGTLRFAYGVDSLQALVLCLQKITAELRHVGRARGATVTWLDSSDLGLPP